MRASPDCKAIRINDEMCCARCGLSWAADDIDKPECKEMRIPPVMPVPRVEPRQQPGTRPFIEAFVCRVQDVTEHTPDRAVNVLVFAPGAQEAVRMVDQALGYPTRHGRLYIQIVAEPVRELQKMAELGSKRVAFTNAEVARALQIMGQQGYGYWHSQTITCGMTAITEINKWLR